MSDKNIQVPQTAELKTYIVDGCIEIQARDRESAIRQAMIMRNRVASVLLKKSDPIST
jgi:hypothetical protein